MAKQDAESLGWLSRIYNMEDLTQKLQSFKSESKAVNLARVALMLANINNVFYIVFIYNLHRLTMFFTNWTLIVTAIYLGVAIAASRY